MSKTRQELEQLRDEFTKLTNKLSELSEDELKQIVGARTDITIKPKDDEFWHSWNPSPIFNKPDLINHNIGNDVKFDDVKMDGSLSNRDDVDPNNKPL